MNLPSLQFCYAILYISLNYPSFEFALRSEGEKGENKTGAKFSLYTVIQFLFWFSSAKNLTFILQIDRTVTINILTLPASIN